MKYIRMYAECNSTEKAIEDLQKEDTSPQPKVVGGMDKNLECDTQGYWHGMR